MTGLEIVHYARLSFLKLDSQDVMETAASRLSYHLRRGSAALELKNSPNDHIGLFKDGKLDDVSYKDLLFNLRNLPFGHEERELYEKYMDYAETDYLFSVCMFLTRGSFKEFLDTPELFRSEMTDYFCSSSRTSGRNEEAHRFSKALEHDYVIKSSNNRPTQYVLKGTPIVEAIKGPLQKELLFRLEPLLEFNDLPDKVKQPLLTCRNVFELQVRYLRRIFSGGALPLTDQEDADGWITPGKNHRVSADSTGVCWSQHFA